MEVSCIRIDKYAAMCFYACMWGHIHRPASEVIPTPIMPGYSLIGMSITGGQQLLMEATSAAQTKSWKHSWRKHLPCRDTYHQNPTLFSLILEL